MNKRIRTQYFRVTVQREAPEAKQRNLNKMAVVFRLEKSTRESDIWERFGGEEVEMFIDAGQQIEGDIHYFFVDVSRYLTYYWTETIIV